MATPSVTLTQQEPVGIVVQDGGEENRHPRIMMWYWADEKGADEVEGRDH